MEKIIDDPNLVAKLAAQVNAEQPTEAKQVKTTAPKVSNIVNLPGGLLTANGVVKDVEVRELTGADEEAIAKAIDAGKALHTILKRGLVSIGSETLSEQLVDTLLSGDRDAILLGIYKITFGTEVLYEQMCTNCGTVIVGAVDLDKDVEVRELDSAYDRSFTIDTKIGLVSVSLPNGVTQRKLVEANTASVAENVTLILSGCIQSVNNEPALPTTALSLGIADRQKIISEIYSKTPGPRLGEVTKVCEACDTEHSVPLSLAALFRV
jgi:hypothetical protein